MRDAMQLAMLVSLCLCGCTESSPGSREDEIVFLKAIMPDSLLEIANLDVGSAKAVAIFGDEPEEYLGLYVFHGQGKVHGGIRAEISVDYPFRQGDTVRYSWRCMLPKDFVSDAPKNRWWIIGQWHDQPNKNQGETWDNFASVSPPVLLGLGELEGRPALGLTYGPTNNDRQSSSVGPAFLRRGEWHNIVIVIRWSQQADGKADVFIDDFTQPALSAAGANMNNDYQHFLKLGMYRHPEIATDNWIYVDDLEISKIEWP